VKTEWNASIVDELEEAPLTTQKHRKKIITVTVPAPLKFHLPLRVLGKHGKEEKTRGIYCVRLRHRGGTPHFDYVCKSCYRWCGTIKHSFACAGDIWV
jgi:6,7-dimethyl-8-ribityllumazine synthase